MHAPLFLFCLVEGFTHTRNRKRYFAKVYIISVIMSALLFFMAYSGVFVRPDGFYPTNGHDLGREVRLGDGKVDFRALFTKLRELGYDSYVTIEREIDGAQQDEDILYAKAFLEKRIHEVYGG